MRAGYTKKPSLSPSDLSASKAKIPQCSPGISFAALELVCLLQMFFSQLSHPKILQPAAEHPMVKRIVGSELVSLFFVRRSASSSLPDARAAPASSLLANTRRAFRRTASVPSRNCFLPAAELPERFAFLLARENQVIPFARA